MIGAAFLAASVFEPVVAIDPARPDRIVAGAQYGDGFNRGGLLFRTLVTNDGGRNWARQEIGLRELDGPPTMAADLSLVFGLEGELYGLGISGEGFRDRVPEAALALGVSRDGGRSFAPRARSSDRSTTPTGAFL